MPAGDRGRPTGRGQWLLWLSLAALVTVVAGLAVLWSVRPPGRWNDDSDQGGNADSTARDRTNGGTRGDNSASTDAGKRDRTGEEALTAEARKKQDYERILTAGKAALAGKLYGDAIKKADDALKLFPDDQAAATLKKDALAARDGEAAALKEQQDYDRFMASGKAALLKKEYDKAIQDADEALKLFPDDQAALNLKKDTRAGQDNVAAALKKKRDFEQLITSGKAALANQKYEDAIKNFEAALQLFPSDPEALALKKDAQAGMTAAAQKVEKKQDYDRLLAAGKAALLNNKYDEALIHANLALKLFPEDQGALQLKKDIQIARDKAVVEKTPRTRSRDGSREFRIHNDKLECMDRRSDKLIWRNDGGGLGVVLSDDDKLVCVIRENAIYAFDAMTGKEVWRNQPRPPVRFIRISITPDKETVLAVTEDGKMLKFLLKTGQPR